MNRLLLPRLFALCASLSACAPDDARREGELPGDCTDGADNDRDGLFDCDDPNCGGASSCRRGASDFGDGGATSADAGMAQVAPTCLDASGLYETDPSGSTYLDCSELERVTLRVAQIDCDTAESTMTWFFADGDSGTGSATLELMQLGPDASAATIELESGTIHYDFEAGVGGRVEVDVTMQLASGRTCTYTSRLR